MNVLQRISLTLSSKDNVKFSTNLEFMTFPGGEPHVKIENPFSHWTDYTANITARISSMEDMGHLMILVDFLKRKGINNIYLYIPYLPGARQDRGAPLTAKVYADVINGFQCNQVIALDPHSDVMPALINNFFGIEQSTILAQAPQALKLFDENTVIVAPDAGAVKKAEKVAQKYGLDVVMGRKHRDMNTGKLSGFSCEPIPDDHHVLVVDDICDGGGTFIGLANSMKYQNGTDVPTTSKSLFVTHGLFSQGTKKLKEHYSRIITTTSRWPLHGDSVLVISHLASNNTKNLDTPDILMFDVSVF